MDNKSGGRLWAASGEGGSGSVRSRPVDLEIALGKLGCGELVLELKKRLSGAAPGQLVRVVTDDAAAPGEIKAWCGMTGHTLVEADPPCYLITVRPAQGADKGGT